MLYEVITQGVVAQNPVLKTGVMVGRWYRQAFFNKGPVGFFPYRRLGFSLNAEFAFGGFKHPLLVVAIFKKYIASGGTFAFLNGILSFV